MRARTAARLLALAVASSPICDAAWVSASLGGYHGIALAATGVATGWGQNDANAQATVPGPLGDLVIQVCAAGFHSCALHWRDASMAAKNITCWGGTGSGAATFPPASVANDPGVKAVVCAGSASCAVRSDDSLVCWGEAGSPVVSPLPTAAAAGVASVSLGASGGCVTKLGTGATTCWGSDSRGVVSGVPPAFSTGTVSDARTACGGYHCCAWGGTPATRDCWGANAAGQATVPASLSTAVAEMCAGGYFSCALASGSVTCWGAGSRGETAVPPSAQDGNVVRVACGWYAACALKMDGKMVCWGGEAAAAAAASLPDVDASLCTAAADATATATGGVVVASGASVAGSGAVSITSGRTGGAGVSGTVVIASGAVQAGTSGLISVSSGAATALGGMSGPVVIGSGAAPGGGPRGAISLLAPATIADGVVSAAEVAVAGPLATGSFTVGNLTIGNTTLSGADLVKLILLATSPSPSATPSSSPSPSVTPSFSVAPTASVTVSVTPSFSVTPTVSPSVTPSASVTPSSSPTPSVTRSPTPTPLYVTTVAGNGVYAYVDGPAMNASFVGNFYLGIDAQDNVYVTTGSDFRVRMLNVTTNVVSTVAGDGTGGLWQWPCGMAFKADGTMYIGWGNQLLAYKNGVKGVVAGSTSFGYADGPAGSALFNYAQGVALQTVGTFTNVYVADGGNRVIRLYTASSNSVSTVAGAVGVLGCADGPAASARFKNPFTVASMPSGDIVISDSDCTSIRLLTLSTGMVSTIVNIGTAPQYIAVDPRTSFIYHTSSSAVYRVKLDGSWTFVAGGSSGYLDAIAPLAQFSTPRGIGVDSQGRIYIADQTNFRIRRIG